MDHDEEDLQRLTANLGYDFNDPGLLVQALTHRSYANEHGPSRVGHNERLEFLGDAVLDLAVGCQLMEMLPRAREGQLTKLRSNIVSEQGLARCARRVDLGAYLRLSHGEERTGGRDKPSILADTYEAVIGAVFLDGGFSEVNMLVWRLMGPLLTEAAEGTLDRDFKGRLQERSQARWQVLPRYEVLDVSGPDHHKSFVVAVYIDGEELARAEGRSKKEAEQAAARRALKNVGTGNRE